MSKRIIFYLLLLFILIFIKDNAQHKQLQLPEKTAGSTIQNSEAAWKKS